MTTMHSRILAICFSAVVIVLCGTTSASAQNWSVFTRHLYPGPTYGCNPHSGMQDCMMPWQPIQSSMHYNVLPPGMYRPWPLHRPTPWLAPSTPDFSAAGVRAAGQHSWGIPCKNRYAQCPAGCSYYCAFDGWQLGRFESYPGIYAHHGQHSKYAHHAQHSQQGGECKTCR